MKQNAPVKAIGDAEPSFARSFASSLTIQKAGGEKTPRRFRGAA